MIHAAPRLLLDAARVVSQASPDVPGWGPWPFPPIERLGNGRPHVSYHIEADSATAYGLPRGHAVSADNGPTWQAASDTPADGGLLPPGGHRSGAIGLCSRSVAQPHSRRAAPNNATA